MVKLLTWIAVIGITVGLLLPMFDKSRSPQERPVTVTQLSPTDQSSQIVPVRHTPPTDSKAAMTFDDQNMKGNDLRRSGGVPWDAIGAVAGVGSLIIAGIALLRK